MDVKIYFFIWETLLIGMVEWIFLLQLESEMDYEVLRGGPTEGACSMAVPAMSTRPSTSALRMTSTHPAIRNANHR